MSNFSTLIASIQDGIKTNGTQAITGQVLQTKLLQMIAELGAGYQFGGVVTPTSTFDSETFGDVKVYYVATEAGTYTNHGSLVVNEGEVALLVYNGSWSKAVTGAATADQLSQLGQEVYQTSGDIIVDEIVSSSLRTILSVFINAQGVWASESAGGCVYEIREYTGINRLLIKTSSNSGALAFLKNIDDISVGASPVYATGYTARINIPANKEMSFDVPSDAKYVYYYNNLSYRPQYVKLYSQSIFNTITKTTPMGVFVIGAENISFVNGVVTFPAGTIIAYKPRDISSNISITFSSDTSFSFPQNGTKKLVIRGNEVMLLDSASDMLPTDILLLNTSNYIPIGGELYPIYLHNGLKQLLFENPVVEMPLNFQATPVSKSSGKFNTTGTSGFGVTCATGKFMTIPKDKSLQLISHTNCPSGTGFAIVFYDNNYDKISDEGWINFPPSGGTYNLTTLVPDTARYFKITIYNSANNIMPDINAGVIGRFEENPYRYNILPSDSGYQTLQIAVDVANVSSDDEQTATLQDSIDMKFDYGLLALPSNYKNTGRPTRMIIYCHGAAVHYTRNTTRFPEGASNFGVEPEYWLNEGYAVMDIEGDPFDNTNKHFYIPQALQCYIAAYDWVVDNYNIARDGVFLGGRSMGASMCLDIINNGHIPVLACCPVSGGFNPISMWNAMGGASYREFVAEHIGLPDADQVSWTNNNPMSAAEFAYLKANFKQLAQFTPLWKMTEMLPGADTLMQDSFNVASSTPSLPAEAAVYDALHLRTGIPFKFFVSPGDTSAVAARASLYVYNMMRNSGSQCEYRVLPTGGHAFELEDQNRVASYTTKRGITMTNVPIVYIEALQFWRRYELQNC